MSKSSQRRISRRTPKTKVSLGTIAEFQRRLDAMQISLAAIWEEGYKAGYYGVATGDEPKNPYLDKGNEAERPK